MDPLDTSLPEDLTAPAVSPPPPAAPAASIFSSKDPYDGVLAEHVQRQQKVDTVNRSLAAAITQNPEEYAKYKRMSGLMGGMDPALILENADLKAEAARRAKTINVDSLIDTSPATVAWLAQSPENAVVAQNDVGALGHLEALAKSIWSAIPGGRRSWRDMSPLERQAEFAKSRQASYDMQHPENNTSGIYENVNTGRQEANASLWFAAQDMATAAGRLPTAVSATWDAARTLFGSPSDVMSRPGMDEQQRYEKATQGRMLNKYGIGFTSDTPMNIVSSIPFSVFAMAGGLAGYAAGAATPVPGAAYVGSMAGAGWVGGALDRGMVWRQLYEMKSAEYKAKYQRDITPSEFNAFVAQPEIEDQVRKHYLFEAGTEAAGNLIFSSTLLRSLLAVGGKAAGAVVKVEGKGALSIAKAAVVDQAGEQATETITQVGQNQAEAALQLQSAPPPQWSSIADWRSAYSEIVYPTLGLGLVLGGGAKIISKPLAMLDDYRLGNKIDEFVTKGGHTIATPEQIDTVVAKAEALALRHPGNASLLKNIETLTRFSDAQRLFVGALAPGVATLNATDGVGKLNGLIETAAGTQMAGHSPDELGAFLQTVGGSVYIDPEGLQDAFAQAGEDLAAVLPTAAEQLADGVPGAGPGVEVPVAELVKGLLNSKARDAVLQHVRMDADSATLAEAKAQDTTKMEAFFQESLKKIQDERATDKVFLAEIQQLQDDVAYGLDSVGTYTPTANKAQAKAIGAFYAVLADKAGVTPLQLRDGWTDAAGVVHKGIRFRSMAAPMQGFSHGQAMLNVGLDVGATDRTQKIDADFVKAEIEKLGVRVLTGRNVPGKYMLNGKMIDELTYVPRLSRPLTDAEVLQLAAATGQEAIAQYHKGVGTLHGTPENLANWGKFNPEFFKDQMGGTLLGEQAAFNAQQGGLDQAKKKKATPIKDVAALTEAASITNASKIAATGKFEYIRDLKEQIQNAVRAAAQGADLSATTPEARKYLTDLGTQEALAAMQSNANAIGWYDTKTRQALSVVALIHPEILTDPDARFAFIYALAVTSNGQKVVKNFELAERAYSGLKATGTMPDNVGAGGPVGKKVHEALARYNDLVRVFGSPAAVEEFMLTEFTAKELAAQGFTAGGENVDTVVLGAAILGPKIGNGFFANLYGVFDRLTMDRWLMRTWGRWTGTLLQDNPAAVAAETKVLKALVRAVRADKEANAAMRQVFAMVSQGKRKGEVNKSLLTAKASPWEALVKTGNFAHIADQLRLKSTYPPLRTVMSSSSLLNELRKSGNRLYNKLDGSNEAPGGGNQRNWLRAVFSDILQSVVNSTGQKMEMADLQALLWYPEKRLYDSAKADDELEGYEDDEAPDYANAAAALARGRGISEDAITAALANPADRPATVRPVAGGAVARELGDFSSENENADVQEGGALYQQELRRAGAVSGPVVGVHYSQQARTALSSSAFGQGMPGAERERIAASTDPRLKQRIAFYVNTGAGIKPESGVGSHAHVATLTNLYDADADVLKLWRNNRGDLNASESAVLDAGFDGYLKRDGLGAAVLLGPRSQAVEPVAGTDVPVVPSPQIPAAKAAAIALATNTSLISGRQTAAEWKKDLTRLDPDMAAKVEWEKLDQEKLFYRQDLADTLWQGTSKSVDINSPEFRAWFGASVVTDHDDRPMVVYHGTRYGDLSELRKARHDETVLYGIAFTPDKAVAERYAKNENRHDFSTGDIKPNVIAAYVQSDRLPDVMAFYEELEAHYGRELDEISNAELEQYAAENGIRAIDTSSIGEPGEIFVLDPSAVKSATSATGGLPAELFAGTPKKGSFSPANMDMRLLADADLSTFLHETSHWFLAAYTQLASEPGAPQALVDEVNALLGHLFSTVQGGAVAGGDLAQQSRSAITPDDIVSNPTPARLVAMLRKSRDKSLRYVVGKDGAFHFWDAYIAVHKDGADAAGVPYDYTRRGTVYSTPDGLASFTWDIGLHVDDLRKYMVGDHILFSAAGHGVVTGAEMAKILDAESDTLLRDLLAQNGPVPAPTPLPAGATPLEQWNNMTLDQQRPYHEAWAESGEQYFMTGKAPSLALDSVFRTFANWLKRIYGSLKEFVAGHTGGKIHPTTAAFFDRMLATEAEIQQANEARGYVQLFKDAAEAGMTENAWAAYQAMGDEQREDAEAMLRARSLRDMKWLQNARTKIIGAMQKEAAEQRKAVREQVATELAATPLRLAVKWLKKGEMTQADGTELKVTEGYKLSKSGIDEIFPEGALTPRPDLSALRGMTAKEGLAPDLVAELANEQMGGNFTSGEDLVRQLLEMKPFKEEVEELTDLRMLQDHSEMIDQAAIERAADEAITNDAHIRMVATEQAALAKGIGSPAQLTKAAKEYARQLIETKTSKTLKPWSFAAAATRARKAAMTALRKGERDEAQKQSRLDLLNTVATKMSYETEAEVKKIIDRFKRIVAYSDKHSSVKSRDFATVQAVRALISQIGIGTKGEKATEYLKLVAAYDPATSLLLSNAIDTFGEKGAWQDIKIGDLRELSENVNALWRRAKATRTFKIGEQRLQMEDVAKELVEVLRPFFPKDNIGSAHAVTEDEKNILAISGIKSVVARMEIWADRVDGVQGVGPTARYLVNVIKTAENNFMEQRETELKLLNTRLKAIAPLLKPRLIDAYELGEGYVFGRGPGRSGMAELIAALQHTGNPSNKGRLLLAPRKVIRKDGTEVESRWGAKRQDGTLDTTQWDAFIKRMEDSGVITKEVWDFVQGTWDTFERLKPQMQAAHMDVFGKLFAEITTEKFTTRFGEYAGGYVPALTDRDIVHDHDVRNLDLEALGGISLSLPMPESGMTKERAANYAQPLALDLGLLGMQLNKALLFAHMAQPVSQVQRLVNTTEVKGALDKAFPGARKHMIMPWLGRAAAHRVSMSSPEFGATGQAWTFFRASTGMARMMGNVSNAAQQYTGIATAAGMLESKKQLIYAAPALLWIGDLRARVREMSTYMRQRMDAETSAVAANTKEILVNPSVFQSARRWTFQHGYFLQQWADMHATPVVWMAAYNSIKEAHPATTEQDARDYADHVVRVSQGASGPTDISTFEAGHPFTQIFTQFSGWGLGQGQAIYSEMAKNFRRDVGLPEKYAKATGIVLLMTLVAPMLAEAIALAFRGGPDDEDDDGVLIDDWLHQIMIMGPAKFAMGTVPVLGKVGNLLLARTTNTPMDDRLSMAPIVSTVEGAARAPFSIYAAMFKDGKPSRAIKDAAEIGTLFGMPLAPIARPVGYLADVSAGRVAPTGPVDAVRGTITGTASPTSKQ